MTASLAGSLQGLDAPQLRREFLAQGKFLYLPHFLPGDGLTQIMLHHAAIMDRLTHRRHEEPIDSAPFVLGAIESRIGVG